MATSNIPKAVLASPNQNGENDDPTIAALKVSVKLHEMVTVCSVPNMQELHQVRIKMLRKELENLKETEWKYEPVDKYIGQS